MHIIQADITNNNDQAKIINILNEVSGDETIEIINNAAFGHPNTFLTTSLDKIRHHFETNFFAPITLLENVVVAAPDQLYWVVPETKATVNVLVAPELTHVAPAITPGAVGFKLT